MRFSGVLALLGQMLYHAKEERLPAARVLELAGSTEVFWAVVRAEPMPVRRLADIVATLLVVEQENGTPDRRDLVREAVIAALGDGIAAGRLVALGASGTPPAKVPADPAVAAFNRAARRRYGQAEPRDISWAGDLLVEPVAAVGWLDQPLRRHLVAPALRRGLAPAAAPTSSRPMTARRKRTKQDEVADYIKSQFPGGVPAAMTDKAIARAVGADPRTVRRARGGK